MLIILTPVEVTTIEVKLCYYFNNIHFWVDPPGTITLWDKAKLLLQGLQLKMYKQGLEVFTTYRTQTTLTQINSEFTHKGQKSSDIRTFGNIARQSLSEKAFRFLTRIWIAILCFIPPLFKTLNHLPPNILKRKKRT